MSESEIIDFYSGQVNKNNITIQEVWDFDYEKLEHVHNYIQWLFPMVEPDYWNRDTPKLSEEDILKFKESAVLGVRLLNSLETVLDFWGLEINYYSDSIIVGKAKNYNDRKDNWQTKMNHNFLRITRVLHCLNDLGFKRVANAFFTCLMELYNENPKGFNEVSVLCWKKAMVIDMKGEVY